MNKKIMLLALAAVSAGVLAVPAMASALVPLHLNPTPVGERNVTGGTAELTAISSGGSKSTIHCGSVSGKASFASGGTTGTLQLTFTNTCTEETLGSHCRSAGEPWGSISTTTLPFHLATLADEETPGVLVTPASGIEPAFAHVECAGGFVKFTVGGNGVVGEIEQNCEESTEVADITFNALGHGAQEHSTVAGTSTIYHLKKGTDTAAQDATGSVALGQETELVCT